jgi:hypothetical protein
VPDIIANVRRSRITVMLIAMEVSMGLDLVEFVMSIEEAFQIRFPDEDMLAITTPRRLIDYLTARLPVATADKGPRHGLDASAGVGSNSRPNPRAIRH